MAKTPARSHEDPNYGTVDYFAGLIRETVSTLSPANRWDHVDAATTGILRSLIAGPGSDAEVRAWFRNALDAGDLVRAELRPEQAKQPCCELHAEVEDVQCCHDCPDDPEGDVR